MPSSSSSFARQRRRLLCAAATLPPALVLGACGGGGSAGGPGPVLPPPSGAVTVTDRRVPLAAGVSLHVRDWQSSRADGITFVLLPGFGATALHFNSLAPALARRGRAIAISCRGFGQSDKPLPDAAWRYDTDALVDDVHTVLEALAPGRVVLGGHSIAGNQVTRFAGRYPQRVRGLMYLDTNFDYTSQPDDGGQKESDNPALSEPLLTEADTASVATAIAYFKRINRNWYPPMEADMLDKLEVRADGSVQVNTPDALALDLYTAARRFSPDYRPLQVPALVFTALPGDRRDMFPWLPAALDATTEKDAADMVRLLRRARRTDAERLFAALPAGSQRMTFDPATHPDFFMAHETEVLRLVDAMTW